MNSATARLQSPSHAATDEARRTEFRVDVLAGLTRQPRVLPSKYFYDVVGSQLFEQICGLDEYYPTRTETDIMLQWGQAMAERIGPHVRLIEYGSGSSVKTRVLLEHLVDPVLYAPVDISGDHLVQTTGDLASEYPSLKIVPVVADFTKPFPIPTCESNADKTCVYFPGSTIGNFDHEESQKLLATAARQFSNHASLLIGIDLQKDVSVLEAAYNDRHGVTAAFNKNLLHRINTELGGDFDLQQFTHRAHYDTTHDRIEMHLVSQCEQDVLVSGHRFHFRQGESIRTECSHKYTIDGFAELAAQSGWNFIESWTDPRNYFAVLFLTLSDQ